MRIAIDGEEFPFPDSMNLKESRIWKDYTGRNMYEQQRKDDEGGGLDPDEVAAICHIALRKANPEWSERKLKERVDTIDKFDIWDEDEVEAAGDDAGPPDESPVLSESSESDESSGASSNGASGATPETTNPSVIGAPV